MRKLLIAAVEGTDVGSVSSVDPHVRAQVEVQRKPFPAAFEGTLKEEERGQMGTDTRVPAFKSAAGTGGESLLDLTRAAHGVLVS